jgi:hypothetical protein
LTEKKGLDTEHLTFVDATEIPAKARRYTPYREILKRIRKGKALVVTEKDANINTVRAGIKRLQRKGEFKKIRMMQRKQEDGMQMLYVVNPSDEETEKKSM